MITIDAAKEKIADLEKVYVDFLVEHFGEWKTWAAVSQKMLDGEKVTEKEVPEDFVLECKLLRTVLEMETMGKFDWNNPQLREHFGQLAQSPFYKLWGKTITHISLRLAECIGVKTLVEIGAGRGNLTGIMLEQLTKLNLPLNLIVTDANPIVIENMEKLKNNYPQIKTDTLLWDINQPPPQELLGKIQHPCLSYERASIMYTNIPSIENIAHFSDAVVLGDMFNYTGELFGYDEISKKIGAYPLFYSEMKPILDKCLRTHYMFDQRAQEELDFPNTTMLIGLK